MYTITVWNSKSTDYNQTLWHKLRGTMTYYVKTEEGAKLLTEVIKTDESVAMITVTCPPGYTRVWGERL